MAYVSEKDYTKLAEAVAEDFVSQNIPLNDSVHKLASQMDMNQEQIKRLCEATNNTVFNKLLRNKQASDDKVVDFDIADSKKVLGEYVKEASWTEEAVGVAALEFSYLPDYRHEEPAQEKTASVAFELRPESRPSKEVDDRTLSKLLDHLNHEKIATHMLYDTTLSSLQQCFKKIYKNESFESFEKNAAALYGTSAVKCLSDLRSRMRMPEVEYNLDTLTKTAGFVDDSTDEYLLLKEAMAYQEKLDKINRAQDKVESRL
jgi:hypothetical protein